MLKITDMPKQQTAVLCWKISGNGNLNCLVKLMTTGKECCCLVQMIPDWPQKREHRALICEMEVYWVG
jgi:hypothetical protein